MIEASVSARGASLGNFENRLREAKQRQTLQLLVRSWKGLLIAVGVIALVTFGISYAATPFIGCAISIGTVKGERISQSSRGDFPRRILVFALDDGRVVEVPRDISEPTRMGARARVESCRKVVWLRELTSHRLKDYLPDKADA